MVWYSKPLRVAGKLPPVTARVTIERNLAVPVAQGVTLLADLYQPTSAPNPSQPLLLVRSPYGRRGKWGAVYGQLFAERGYTVLVQSTRGTGGSTGPFEPMVHEGEDGRATVAWLREQPWFNGGVVVMGASYLAFAGWALATDPPPELRGLVSHVGPHEWRSAIYPRGVLALDFAVTWSANRLRPPDPDTFLLSLLKPKKDVRAQLGASFSELPLDAAVAQDLAGGAPWLHEWLKHGTDPSYWAAYDASRALEAIDVPVLLLGGWHDMFLEQTVHQYTRLGARGVPTTLVVGPWTHRGLEKDWPAMVARTLAWLPSVHDGAAHSGAAADPQLHLGGTQTWISIPSWPAQDAHDRLWVLQPDGVLETGTAWAPNYSGAQEPDTYAFDPTAPTPTVGGATTREDAGPQDNGKLEQRADVLTYTSPPLDQDVDILGTPAVSLRLQSQATSFDCFARLCVVTADGTSRSVTDGITRVHGSAEAPMGVQVHLAPTAHRLERGQRVRLVISGGSHPRFARNLGSGHPEHNSRIAVPQRTKVHYDPAHPSTLTLPVRAAG